MSDDLAYHMDGCACATHASISRFLAEFEPPPPLGIPAHRVNAFCKQMGSGDGRPDVNPTGPNLGDEFDTHGAGSMYRDEGMWRWNGVTDRHKKGRGR